MTASYFVGYHRYPRELDRGGDCFAVFRLDNDLYYWQMIAADDMKTPRGMVHGPFPTSESAFLSAIGD